MLLIEDSVVFINFFFEGFAVLISDLCYCFFWEELVFLFFCSGKFGLMKISNRSGISDFPSCNISH
jgi:hypothetical protein